MVDIFALEIGAALGELKEERDGLGFRDVSVLDEEGFEVAG